MSKKIVFFTGYMGRGGAERVISILSRQYAELGWTVQIVMLLHKNVEYDLDSRVELVDLSSDKGIRKDCVRVLGRIRKFLKKEQPSICVVFMAQICLLVGLAASGLHIPLVMSERIDPSQVKRNYIYRKSLNYFYSHCKRTVLQTQRAMRYFPSKVQNNSTIITNPICVNTEVSSNPKHRIVTAGRLEPQKNQKMLIRAFAEFKKCFPEYSMDIYGEGTLKEELQALINELGMSDCIKLPGNVPNLHECIADAEIFVLPSNFEGLSNALLEAMMMGLPCIATRCAGCDEVIDDGENGLLIDVGDTDGLVQAMVKLASDPSFARRLAKRSKQDSSQFHVDNVIAKWRRVIEE